MSSVTTITSQPPAAAQPLGNLELNAFMIIMNAMLGNMDVQQNGMNLSMEKEQLLKARYDELNKAVQEEEAKLKALNTESSDFASHANYNSPADMARIQEFTNQVQAEMTLVQASESKLGNAQNQIVQEFKRGIDPAQAMMKNDSVMFGSMLHSYLLTERTK